MSHQTNGKTPKPPKTPEQLAYQHKMHMAARVTKRKEERQALVEKQKIQMAELMAQHREEQRAERIKSIGKEATQEIEKRGSR